jgi:hypothetical protein
VEMHEAVGAAARENENGIGLLFLLRYHASSQCPVFAAGVYVYVCWRQSRAVGSRRPRPGRMLRVLTIK